MKKIALFVGLAFVAGVSFAALETITSQDATKTGLESMRTKLNSNFSALPTRITTNVVVQTDTITVTVAATLATNTIIYLDASSNVVTNTIIYVNAKPTASFTGVTNVSVQTKTP